MDSLHTQHQTLHQMLYDPGADYRVALKHNPPTILATAQPLLSESFSLQEAGAHPTCRVSGLCEQRAGKRIQSWIIVRDVTPPPRDLTRAGAAALWLCLGAAAAVRTRRWERRRGCLPARRPGGQVHSQALLES